MLSRSLLRRGFPSRISVCAKGFSTLSEEPKSTDDSKKEVLIYEGLFASKLKLLRRFSLLSTLFTMTILPTAMESLVPSTSSVLAQYIVSGGVIITTLSSTILLQLVTHPYVAKGYIIPGKKEKRYRVLKYNLLGNYVVSEFNLSEIEKPPSMSFAFTNFSANNQLFMMEKHIKDDDLLAAVSKYMKKPESDPNSDPKSDSK